MSTFERDWQVASMNTSSEGKTATPDEVAVTYWRIQLHNLAERARRWQGQGEIAALFFGAALGALAHDRNRGLEP